jgi:hypothetical protein
MVVIIEVITVMNNKLKQGKKTLLKVNKELNRNYKVLIDNKFMMMVLKYL